MSAALYATECGWRECGGCGLLLPASSAFYPRLGLLCRLCMTPAPVVPARAAAAVSG